ncbi:MAG: N-acetylmuramoyl-L-alanine amidase [Gemmatimonadales bacterium]|nr:MAG: N-acetylmuramoyl-L-alanine amidase [Gemmatimonadales bacterium]
MSGFLRVLLGLVLLWGASVVPGGASVPEVGTTGLVAGPLAWATESVSGATHGASVTPDDRIHILLPDGRTLTLEPARHRGFAAFPARALEPLGWQGASHADEFILTHRTGLELAFRPGSPFFWWDEQPVQLVHAPYAFGNDIYLPVQLLVDLFPGFLPVAYQWDPERSELLVEGAVPADADGAADAPATEADRAADPGVADVARAAPDAEDRALVGDRLPRLVVIDPGHGGHDTGAIGPSGVMEKDVALALSLALYRRLSQDPDLEVRLTREADEFVPLWERGGLATQWKGDRPGVFLSIHANSLTDRPTVRGFETYFLSEARTEHERRVAAAENASAEMERPEDRPAAADPLLAEIIRDLRTFDHQQWSALLADMVQSEMGRVHPGPDRGVKQGPFAVITNAMMPSVLIEVGFLSNADEERLLMESEFHDAVAEAVARSVERFFQRYPPGRSDP